MLRRRAETRRVFFPWERRTGALGLLGRTRLGLVGSALGIVAFVGLVHAREESRASIRATRASIGTAYRAVEAWRADHPGSCPRDFTELVASGYARDPALDAWGRPLRVICPGRRDPRGFEVSSDGPDGIAGGLDRVE